MAGGIGLRVRRTRREGKGIAALVLPNLRRAAHYATDASIKEADETTRRTIRSVGLGKLANAIGSTSSLRKRRTSSNNAWGAIYARGRPGGRGEQALLAYSEGARISPRGGRKWLAFATKAIPTRVGRLKMTPELYQSSGLTSSIGRLVFIQRSAKEALLIVRKVQVSRRTGRAKAGGGRKGRGADAKGFIVAFILIRFTSRAQRFNQGAIVRRSGTRIPFHVEQYQLQNPVG